MNQIETQSCPECESSLVDDVHNGETICSGCGIVVADQMVNFGPESVTSDMQDKMKLARATGSITYNQHDLGMTTDISISTKDYSGKSINPQMISKMNHLRKWQTRTRVSSSQDRRRVNVLTTIGNVCKSLSLPPNILETSSIMYRNIDNKIDVKGKSILSMSIATVYMACKQCDVVRSMEELAQNVCTPKELKSKTKLAAKYYRDIVMTMGSNLSPVVTMDKYISKIANLTKIDVRIERLALEIAEKTKDGNISDGKAPNGIAAAYLYISSILLGYGILQSDVSSIAGVTEVTIRNRCKEILSCYKLRVTLRPSLAR
jgi:transcription initiation factor TFIIB